VRQRQMTIIISSMRAHARVNFHLRWEGRRGWESANATLKSVSDKNYIIMPIIRELAFRQTNVSLINTSRVAGERKLKSALTMHVTPEQHARGDDQRISTTLRVALLERTHVHAQSSIDGEFRVARSCANVRMCRECEYRSEHRSDAQHLPSNGFHSFFSLSCRSLPHHPRVVADEPLKRRSLLKG